MVFPSASAHLIASIENYIRWLINHCGSAWPSQKHMAARFRCTVRTIQRAIARLRAAGVLITTREPRGRRRSQTYVLAASQTAQLDLFSGEPQPEQKAANVVSNVVTEKTPTSLRLWRRAVSVPLVIFRFPEYLRKRRAAREAATDPYGRPKKRFPVTEYEKHLAALGVEWR